MTECADWVGLEWVMGNQKLIGIMLVALTLGSCATISDEDQIIRSEMYKNIPANQPIAMSTKIGEDTLTMRSEAKFAGAISSLTFRGQEYVNSDDHGRLMQGAIAYNLRYECLNPTQAGGSRDRNNLGQRSSSKRLLSYVTLENDVFVTTRMAYWLRPGMTCQIPGVGRSPVDNRQRLSGDIYAISHRFGLNGHRNLAAMDITYTIEKAYDYAVVEALTIYTPPAFDTFHSIDPVTGALTLEPTLTSDETPAPIILSTTDGAHAIAFISLQKGATYARFRFPDTNKISLVYRDADGITGENRYSAAWAIGTREEVATRLREILVNQREFGFAGD
jgi:hypothetical protein